MTAPPRIHALDYLRGLAALGVALYHYRIWTDQFTDADTVHARLGLYGVSLFFVLSGMSLMHVYGARLAFTGAGLLDFYRRRFFRIYPLLWLTLLLSVLSGVVVYSYRKLLLDITGLFAVFDWDKPYVVGAWSIGAELLMYVLLPGAIWLLRRHEGWLWLLTLLLGAVFMYFSWAVMEPVLPFDKLWRAYTHPMNHLFYFLAGCLLAWRFREKSMPQGFSALLLLGGCALLLAWPGAGDRSLLVSGGYRMGLSLGVLLLALGAFTWRTSLPRLLHVPLSRLGEACYSLYLLHPVVLAWLLPALQARGVAGDSALSLGLFLLCCLLLSLLSWHFFERFWIRVGRGKPQP